jgi:4-hydroxy-tetrahydrodipicolinate synthase
MKNQKSYHGVVIPMVTPFDEKGTIDIPAVERLLNLYVDTKTIPFILGTTGEGVSIPLTLRVELIKQVMKLVGDQTEIYAGIADTCPINSLIVAQEFHQVGVKTFVCHVPPYYPLLPEQILTFFESLADKLPAPLMLYNIPATTKVSIPLDVIGKLSKHPNIIGIKDSERSMERMDLLAEHFKDREDFAIFNGWTTKSSYALLAGFDGIVPSTANLIPKLFADLYQAVMEGDKEKAEEIQDKIDPIADFHQQEIPFSHMIPILKVMMDEFELCGPTVLPPLTRLGAKPEEQFRKSMKELDFGGLEPFGDEQ